MTDQPQVHAARRWRALSVAIVALAAAGSLVATAVVAVSGPEPMDDTPAMLAVAPGGTVELAALPAEHQELYRAANADAEAFEAIACYCGCEAFLDHRHLRDCFVRPDGGWERHASGCSVCLAEARDVVELRGTGTPIDDITRHIDERYGAIAAPTT